MTGRQVLDRLSSGRNGAIVLAVLTLAVAVLAGMSLAPGARARPNRAATGACWSPSSATRTCAASTRTAATKPASRT